MVDGVMTSAAWATNVAAQEILRAARKVARDVLTGSEWVAVEAANKALDAALLSLSTAQTVSDGTLTALADATNAIGGALSRAKLKDFLQLNSLSISAVLDSYTQMMVASYDFNIGGGNFQGSLAFDWKDPIGSLVKLAKDLAFVMFKQLFPTLQRLL